MPSAPPLLTAFSATANIATSLNKQKPPYLKYFTLMVGGSLGLSFGYQLYKWIWQVPICPRCNDKQPLGIHNVLSCSAWMPASGHPCSGRYPMRKIGAATGINYKLLNVNSSWRINISDKPITLRNLFDESYSEEYVHTLGDLIVKLDESYRTDLLSNKIGFYIYVCPECRSTLTRRMISCTSYLADSGLLHNALDISEVDH